MDGWTVARKRRHERQIELGIIDGKYTLPETQVQSWDQLSHEQKVALDRQMAVYAAQMDNLDHNIGRLLAALEESGQAENTMVLFFSDNGATESQALGWERNKGAIFGTRGSFGGYATGWAEVSNTPFRLFKMFAHHSGTASPMIAWWPGTIEHGGIRHQPVHTVTPGELDLHSMIQPIPATAKFINDSLYIWGGTLVKSHIDQKYHLFYSRWPREHGFSAWVTSSETLLCAVNETLEHCIVLTVNVFSRVRILKNGYHPMPTWDTLGFRWQEAW